MGQAQSRLRISSEKPIKWKMRKKKRGKSRGGCFGFFSILSCVGGPERESASSSGFLLREQVIEDDEELLLSLAGPLVPYIPVQRPAPSSRPTIQVTNAGKLLLSDLASLETLTFFIAPVWLKEHLELYLTPAGKMVMEESSPSRGQPEAEKEASFCKEEPEMLHEEGVFDLVDLWNSSDLLCTRRYVGRLQTLEEVSQLLHVVLNNNTQLWWRKQLKIDILNPEGSVAVSIAEQEVTGVQLLGGRKISHVMSHSIKHRKEFHYSVNGQEVDMFTSFEGFAQAGGDTQTTSWTSSARQTDFSDPPASHTSPPPPPFDEDFEDNVNEVPLMQTYFAYKEITGFQWKLVALRNAFQELTNTTQSLNFMCHAGRMVLGGLAQLNGQDVRLFQQAYDCLVTCLNEPENRETTLDEVKQLGITQINFIDLFFELFLLGVMKGKSVSVAPRPHGFLDSLFKVILSIGPPGQKWNHRAESFLTSIRTQMESWMETIFHFDDNLYNCSQSLSGEVLQSLQMQVEVLFSILD